MLRRGIAVVLGLCACTYPPLRGADRGKADAVAARLTSATTEAELAPMLHAPLGYGGLWFDDPACAEFAGAGTIEAARLDRFARCLATLHLRASDRRNPFPDILVLEYAPGFEVEAQLDDDGTRLHWIGYAGRHDVRDALPTVTPAALERLRVDGAAQPQLDAAGLARLASERAQTGGDVSIAWMKICLDAEGNVTGAHPRQITSPIAAEVFGAAVRSWKFRPFEVGGHAIPVCSMIQLAEPRAKLDEEAARTLPYPVPPDLGEVIVAPAALHRTFGDTMLVPDDVTKTEISARGPNRLIVSFAFCIDRAGTVVGVRKLRGSPFERYDVQVGGRILTWRYQPFVIDGEALPVCSTLTAIYRQH